MKIALINPLTIMFLFIVTSISLGQRTLPTTEHFDYSLGELRTVGTDWSRVSGTSNDLNVIDGNLTYTGYPMSATGRQVSLSNSGTDDLKLSMTSYSTPGDKIYASFLVNVLNTTGLGTGAYFAALGNGVATVSYLTRLWIRLDGTGFNLGLSKNSNTVAGWTNTLSISTTYLVVLYYEIVSGTSNDIAKLWVNPDLSGSEPLADITTSANNDGSIDGFYLRQASGTPNVYIDAIRIGTSWSDAPLPVRLTSFTALVRNNLVNLKWTTATEVQNYGFEIERAQVTSTSPRNLRYAKVGFVRGSGNSNSPKEYSFVDNTRLYGVYSYRLKQIDIDGGYDYSDAVSVRVGTRPIVFDAKNFPNPFNPETIIEFDLPNSAYVNLSVYNSLGEKVATIVDDFYEEGIYQEKFDGRNLSSGVYFYVLKADGVNIIKKMLMMK